ncbi:MAG: TonB-dependent receptor [Fibrobacterales bacterium]
MDLLKIWSMVLLVITTGSALDSTLPNSLKEDSNNGVQNVQVIDYTTLTDTLGGDAGDDTTVSRADSVVVTGALLNGTTGEGYALRSVMVGPVGKKIITDEDGFFEITLSRVDSLSFYVIDDTLQLEENIFPVVDSLSFVNVILKVGQSGQQMEQPDSVDMIVVAERGAIHDRKKVSSFKVTRSEMQEVAGTMGDPMRVIGSLPGVTMQSDLSVRSFVRGGKAEETRVFWNDVPLLQPYHMGTIFSIFNMEHIDNAELYTGNLPIDMNNALSAALVTENRKPPKDSLMGFNELSFMRTNMYIGAPLTDKLSADISIQYFHWDWFVKRVGDIVTSGDSKQKNGWDKAKKIFAIPTFMDIQAGLEYAVNQNLTLNYRGLYAVDWFYVLDPLDITREMGNDTLHLDSIDTLAYVGVDNWVHTISADYRVSDDWKLKAGVAYQSQKWDIQFGGKGDNIFTNPKFDLKRSAFHAKVNNVFTPNEKHVVSFGAAFDLWMQEYNSFIIRPLYEIFVNGNYDVVKMIGMDLPEGKVVTVNDGGTANLVDMVGRIRFDHRGKRNQQFYALYGGDKWTVNEDLRVDLGLRLEYGSGTGDGFPSPRAALFKKIDEQNELTLSMGLYSQNDIPYYMLDQNSKLKSEKNIMGEVEWSHDFTLRYRFEWRTYGKYYFDLVAAHATNHPLPKTRNELVNTITHFYHTLGKDEFISDNQDQMINNFLNEFEMSDTQVEEIFGESGNISNDLKGLLQYSEIAYDNEGTGYALGSELLFRYDPNTVWRGWISAEISTSQRKDSDEGIWYNFSDFRPWAIKWNNYFNMPNDWEIAFRYTIAGGKAYTPFEQNFEVPEGEVQDTIMVIGKKNSQWYNMYERLDISLAQNSTFFGLPSRTYMEIWNAFNAPNFLLRDSETNKVVTFEPNLLVPTIFFGWQLRW